jgi:hypothetical protein
MVKIIADTMFKIAGGKTSEFQFANTMDEAIARLKAFQESRLQKQAKDAP